MRKLVMTGGFILRAACVCFLFAFGNLPGLSERKAGTTLNAAIRAFEEGRFREAETQLRVVLGAEPRNASAWKVLGVVYAAQGLHDLASEPFTEACKLDASEPDACYYLARNHYLRNRFTESLALFDQLLVAARHDARYLNGRGLALSGLGRFEDAEQSFIQATRQERGGGSLDEKPAINLGSLYLRNGQPDKAAAVLREVTSKHPGAARAWFELGKAELQLDDPQAAVRALEQAIAARRQYSEAHLLLAKIHARLGDPRKAAAHRRLAELH